MSRRTLERIRVVDSHTGGEPTRVVVEGFPQLAGQTVSEQRDDFRAHHDAYRTAIICEPRGSDVLVGALLVEPAEASSTAGVIFFNNAGMLGMCGHGTIGLIVTLAHLGRIVPGTHRIETPVGIVTATLHEAGTVSVQNVPSYRLAKGIVVEVPGHGQVVGDVAWGGNWFFLVEEHGQDIVPTNLEALTAFTWRIRMALMQAGITGQDGQEIDHIELFAPSRTADSRNFVLCPGKAYDRSPCGTGTSAKLACLHADGKLAESAVWRQESVIGSLFEGSVVRVGNEILPTISGTAFITGEATLILDPADPFCWGI